MTTFQDRNFFRFVVNFDTAGHWFDECKDGKWVDSKEGAQIREWLGESTPGKYSIGPTYVLFEENDDALLCYLRYRG